MALSSRQYTTVAAAVLLASGLLVITYIVLSIAPKAVAESTHGDEIEVRGLVSLVHGGTTPTPFRGAVVTITGMQDGKAVRSWTARAATWGTRQGAEFNSYVETRDGGSRFDAYRFGLEARGMELRCTPEGAPACQIPARRAAGGVLTVNIEAMQ